MKIENVLFLVSSSILGRVGITNKCKCGERNKYYHKWIYPAKGAVLSYWLDITSKYLPAIVKKYSDFKPILYYVCGHMQGEKAPQSVISGVYL